MEENEIGTIVLDVAFQVHRDLGPGLLETVYEVVLVHELKQRGLQAHRQVPIPIKYGDLKFDEGFRADIIIENRLIVELKCVERINNAHKKQLLLIFV
jgi:GxxExxY protein